MIGLVHCAMAYEIRLSRSAKATVDALADCLASIYGALSHPARVVWHPYPLRVVDVALAVGLGRKPLAHAGPDYHNRVVPGVRRFAEQYPTVRTLGDLQVVVAPSPETLAAELWEAP